MAYVQLTTQILEQAQNVTLLTVSGRRAIFGNVATADLGPITRFIVQVQQMYGDQDAHMNSA